MKSVVRICGLLGLVYCSLAYSSLYGLNIRNEGVVEYLDLVSINTANGAVTQINTLDNGWGAAALIARMPDTGNLLATSGDANRPVWEINPTSGKIIRNHTVCHGNTVVLDMTYLAPGVLYTTQWVPEFPYQTTYIVKTILSTGVNTVVSRPAIPEDIPLTSMGGYEMRYNEYVVYDGSYLTMVDVGSGNVTDYECCGCDFLFGSPIISLTYDNGKDRWLSLQMNTSDEDAEDLIFGVVNSLASCQNMTVISDFVRPM